MSAREKPSHKVCDGSSAGHLEGVVWFPPGFSLFLLRCPNCPKALLKCSFQTVAAVRFAESLLAVQILPSRGGVHLNVCAYCLWRALYFGEVVPKLSQNRSRGRGFKMQIPATAKDSIYMFRMRIRNANVFTSSWYHLAEIFWKTLLRRWRGLLAATTSVLNRYHFQKTICTYICANTAKFCVTGLSLSFPRGISDLVSVNSKECDPWSPPLKGISYWLILNSQELISYVTHNPLGD